MVAILSDRPGTYEEHIEAAEKVFPGPAYSFFCGDELVCCAGVTVKWAGCGEVWLAPAKCWGNYKREVVIWTRKVLDDLQNNFSLRRIQAFVLAGDGVAQQYLKHYGFKIEGKAEAYDAEGRDCIMMARVKRDVT